MNPRALARTVALGRIGLGVALLVAPERLATPWVGRDGSRAGAKVITRGLAARDLALGAGAIAVTGEALRPWLAAAVIADLGDLLATLAAGGSIPQRGRWLVSAVACGGAALGGASLAGVIKQA